MRARAREEVGEKVWGTTPMKPRMRPVDSVELQEMDEFDIEWVEGWKREVGKHEAR